MWWERRFGEQQQLVLAHKTKTMQKLAVFILFCVMGPSVMSQVDVPDWALPGSATHKQVPPPAGFHRDTRTEVKSLGVFQGQSDVGAALVPGSSSYDPHTGAYTIV